MKKRHQQKLILISVSLLMLFNLPLIFTYNDDKLIFGFPLFYFVIFTIWLVSIILSWVILKKYHD